MSMNKFWTVVSEDVQDAINVRFATKLEAEQTAERLAKEHNISYVVTEAVKYCSVHKIIWTDIDVSDKVLDH